jgi:hypothetical protein
MANIVESVNYDTGVYQIATTDPVQGGAGGIANLAAQNLANRTAYLKQHLDNLESGATIPSTVAPKNSPVFTGDPQAPTPALGDNDTSIATSAFVQGTVNGVLNKSVAGSANVTLTAIEAGNGIWILTGALNANIDVIVPGTSKQMLVVNRTTGAYTLRVKTSAGAGVYVMQGMQQELFCDGTDVKVATNDFSNQVLDLSVTQSASAAQFDNSLKLASTAFVQRALGNIAGQTVISGNATLTAANAGQLVLFNGSSASTITLPAVSAMPGGSQIHFMSIGTGTLTIARAGTDAINVNSGQNVQMTLSNGDTLTLESTGSVWNAVDGSGQLKYASVFGASFAAAGYQKLPSGLIIQWCYSTYLNVPAGTQVNAITSWPTPFPNACLWGGPVCEVPSGTNINVFLSTYVSSTTQVGAAINSASTQNVTVYFIGIGY